MSTAVFSESPQSSHQNCRYLLWVPCAETAFLRVTRRTVRWRRRSRHCFTGFCANGAHAKPLREPANCALSVGAVFPMHASFLPSLAAIMLSTASQLDFSLLALCIRKRLARRPVTWPGSRRRKGCCDRFGKSIYFASSSCVVYRFGRCHVGRK